MKNTTEEKESWSQIKGDLIQRFAAITDNEIMLAGTKQDELISNVQIKLGQTKETLNKLNTGL